jgi:hypothetical protein
LKPTYFTKNPIRAMLKKTRIRHTLLLFCSLMLLPALSSAQPPKPDPVGSKWSAEKISFATAQTTFKLVLIGSTDDTPKKRTIKGKTKLNDIQSCVKTDIKRYEALADYIKYYLPNIKLRTIQIVGADFERDKMVSRLDTITCDSNTVLMVVYIGHGWRFIDTKSAFPWLLLHNDSDETALDMYGLHLEALHKKMVAKGARLTLSIANACNDIVSEPTSPGLVKFGEPCPETNAVKLKKQQFYARLFLEKKGDIIASSSKAGEESDGDSESTFYHRALRESLTSDTFLPMTWQEVFDNTAKIVTEENNTQHPIYRINLTNYHTNNTEVNTGLGRH